MVTRSVAKMEEQLATLIAKMDEQNEQLQVLTKQQSQRIDAVAKKQEETQEHVEAMAGDLDSVKATMHGRLGEVEEAVSSVKTLQTELGERQKSLKAELHDELLRELSEVVGKTGLRPTAPSFIPATTTRSETVAAAGDGSSRGLGDSREAVEGESGRERSTLSSRGGSVTGTTMQRPAPFDGKGTWDAYHTQFEMLARINKWNDLDKAAYLAISLRGPAATVLTNLPPDQRQDYTALTAALQARFGTAHQTELNRMKLKARTRRREESLPELAEDIERLVRLAYPDAAESMVEVLAKDQFVDALPEEDMRLHIRQNRLATLRAALETALELESYQLASKQRARFVREVQLEKQPVQLQQEHAKPKESNLNADVLQQLVEALKHCCPEAVGSTPHRSRRERAQGGRSNLVCWNCEQKGHRRKDCPELKKEEVSQPGNGQ